MTQSKRLALYPSFSEVGIEIGKVTRCKSSGSDKIQGELITAEGETLLYEAHKLIISIWNKQQLPDQWKQSIILPVLKEKRSN
jgi:hypothetical protein